jgi:RimJ/RimL family protein N-acetyltransferase
MKLTQSKIDKKAWLSQLNKIGMDKKWFLSICNQLNTDFNRLYILSSNEERIEIGGCAFTQFDDVVDCSIFIFPEYRRKGYAKKCISELISSFVNIQFTVSKYNTKSLSLFESIANLKKSEINTRNMTYSFTKNSNICT